MIPAPPTPCTHRHRLPSLALAGLIALTAGLFTDSASAQDSKQAPAAANTATPGCNASAGVLDWQPLVELPPGSITLRNELCRGGFVDPLAGLDTSADPADANIEASATRSEARDDIVRLSGGVEIQQGYRQFRADEVEFDINTQLGSLHGNVEVREPGLLLRGATGSFNAETGTASLTAGQIVLHQDHFHGGADLVVRRDDDVFELDDAYFSSCPPLQEQWVLRAKDLTLDVDNGVGTARDAKIEMGGVPVFYLPYLQFPLDDRRRSGFLWPELGHDSNGGMDIAAPYYFNLAPNYDATLTPRYIADRGVLTELETRYLGVNTGYWEVAGAWIGGDDEYQSEYPDDDGDRWLTAVEQHGLFSQRWRTLIDYTNVSDDDYFRDLGTTSLQVQQSSHIAQRGEINYLGDNWLADFRLEEYKTISRDIDTQAYRKLPQVSLLRSTREQDFSPNLLLLTDYTYFDHDTELSGHRLYNALGVSYPMRWMWGYVRPVAKYRQINYDLDESVYFDQQVEDRPDVGAPLVNLDAGLFFERDLQWGDTSFLQTLEPRLYYLWADYEDQVGLPDFDTSELTFGYGQLFRETRFSGKDRLNDANQVSVGITTRIIDTDSGAEKFSASIGQIYYFDDRRVNVDAATPEDFEGSSGIAAEFSASPLNELSVRTSWLWNTDADQVDQTYTQIRYDSAQRFIFNVGYSYNRYLGVDPDIENISQVDLSTYIPVTNEWSLFLASLYDLQDHERVNDMAGIEYNNCCWRARLVFERHLDQTNSTNVQSLAEHENAIYFEFQLKGLGGVGTRVTSMLEEVIRGYQDSDE